jgi:hypothetical protein
MQITLWIVLLQIILEVKEITPLDEL